MENLLYYPWINVPNSDWTNRALLYYETIGCIIPSRYNEEPKRFENHMRELVRENLVIPLNPSEIISDPWQITKPFIEYVESKDFDLKKRRAKFSKGSKGRIHREKFSKAPQIHIDKFDREVFYRLEHAGLAEKRDDEWYNVEKSTANELMAYISTIIAEKLNCRPMSDKVRRFIPHSRMSKKDFKEIKIQQSKREIILNEIIPFPENIDFTKLRKFKEEHYDLLDSFRNKVELIALNPSIEIETEFFNEKIKELTIGKRELTAKMNESNFGNIFFGSICGAASAALAFSAGFGWLGLPAFVNAIHSALKIETAENVPNQNGMKYLALMDKRISKTSC